MTHSGPTRGHQDFSIWGGSSLKISIFCMKIKEFPVFWKFRGARAPPGAPLGVGPVTAARSFVNQNWFLWSFCPFQGLNESTPHIVNQLLVHWNSKFRSVLSYNWPKMRLAVWNSTEVSNGTDWWKYPRWLLIYTLHASSVGIMFYRLLDPVILGWWYLVHFHPQLQ